MEQPALNTLVLRAQHWEMLCRDLQKEKHVMEEQFGQQRKKFMNLMMQKDQELDTVKRSVEQFSGEAVRLNKLLRTKEEEVRLRQCQKSSLLCLHRFTTYILSPRPWSLLIEKHLMLTE